MNTVILYGRNCQELELNTFGKGKDAISYVRFNLAVKNVVGGQGDTMFVPCIVWGRQAETMAEYVKKGDRLCLEGRLNIQKYEDKEDGKTRTSVQVVVNRFDFVESNRDRDEEPAEKSSKRKR